MIFVTFICSVKFPLSGWLSCESVSPKFVKKILTEWRANLPLGGLAADPFRLSFNKILTEWRASLPLGGLAAVQVLA